MRVFLHEGLHDTRGAIGGVIVNHKDVNLRFKLAHARDNRRNILRLVIGRDNNYSVPHVCAPKIARYRLLRNAKLCYCASL